jgi:hypothetical protein
MAYEIKMEVTAAPTAPPDSRLRSEEELALVLEEAVKRIKACHMHYRRYYLYYRGVHRLVFASEKWRNAFGYIFQQFADNLCPTVVNVLVDRLQLTQFEADDNATEAHVDAANQLWEANKMDVRAGEVMKTAVKCGDSYLLVRLDPRDPEKKRIRFYPQNPWNIAVEYDPEDHEVILWGAKLWRLPNGRHRIVLYFPEGEYHFITKNKEAYDGVPEKSEAWEPFPMIETGVNYELKDESEPQRVPIFHFANDAECGGLGVSELANVLPLQDLLNKSVMDMAVAMEFVALPQRYATGIEIAIDPESGEAQVPFEPGVDKVWATESENVKFGEFPAADLTKMVSVQDGLRVEIARVSGTPLHHFMLHSGEAPSGEALRALEARLIKKAMDRQGAFGDVWEAIFAYALALLGQEDVTLCAKWTDPAPISDKELAETVKIKKVDIGISQKQAWRELGYTEEEIEKMEGEKEEEAEATAEQQLRMFDAGGPAGTYPGGTRNAQRPRDQATPPNSGRSGGAGGPSSGPEA